MTANFKHRAVADLHAVLALVAGSAIVSAPAPQPPAFFSDWEKQRKSPEVDALILAWIAGHVPRAAQRGRLH
jgi:hypothetical protein